jgi:predicted  nucleic acid-binding Zn-ribbon protein
MSNDRLDVIEARLERLTAVAERTADNVEAISEEVKSLTQQVGILTMGLTEIRLTTERQEQNITRLVNIVETLITQKGG